MKRFLISLISFTVLNLHAQHAVSTADSSTLLYQPSFPHINDLVHTRLDVRFDYTKSYLYGKAWITLKPHFYPTDSLSLDAKGMDIHTVSLVKGTQTAALKYNYDGSTLFIHLNKTYRYTENYTIYIDYTSKPNELKVQGSAAITDAKGLYFINPLGKEKDKPTEIWTQGETESNSVWFPTIDKPDQKSTEEISMTVPAKYVTLSNGKLIAQVKNADGTRTDKWKMDLPHAPYLFFMGIGDYAIVKDHYKGKEVNYYVEKEYASVARRIFGNTPEMMAFYSRILGIEFPWPKYSQMVARDFVSGAMENTTATLHMEDIQQDARELTDGNKYEDFIAHELFHHWFGDLATAESWSNLTLNESFADFSETLWFEYKYGKDAGDALNYKGIEGYLSDPSNPSKNLVRFYYSNREDMFDDVSYAKGGRILNMLRNYVGDSAFFKSLNLYLENYKFKSAEAHNLRIAFEQVTGQDLNWYWNQWYYGSGHPVFDMEYQYDEVKKKALVIVRQTQGTGKIFRIPMAIDVYEAGKKNRHEVWLENESDSFYFSFNKKPDLINVDGDKIILCQKKDHKTLENFIYQYAHAGLYLDRREAIEYCLLHQDNPAALAMLKQSLKDPYFELRKLTLKSLELDKSSVKLAFEPQVMEMAANDADRTVQGIAIGILRSFKDQKYKSLFLKKTKDSSYTVAGNALTALTVLDTAKAIEVAEELSAFPAKGSLLYATTTLLIINGDYSKFDLILDNFKKLDNQFDEKFDLSFLFAGFLLNSQSKEQFELGIDALFSYRNKMKFRNKKELQDMMDKNMFSEMASFKERSGDKNQAAYIRVKMNEKE